MQKRKKKSKNGVLSYKRTMNQMGESKFGSLICNQGITKLEKFRNSLISWRYKKKKTWNQPNCHFNQGG
jgi:hypothetical protein